MAQGVITSVGLRPRLERLTIVGPAVTRSRACLVVCLVLPSAAFYALVLRMVVRGVERGSDFASFWAGAGRVLHGVSPYPAVGSLPAVADRLTFVPYVYPPPAAFALGPLSPLPFWLADTIFFCLIMAAVALALRVLDVTDWRCYAAGFACVPVMAAVAVGSLSTLLLLGVALAWRWRHTTWRLAAVVAALVVAKLFLWPLWLWLVYTRRLKAAALSAAVGAAATFGAWAVIGFAGLGDYPTLLSRLSELVGKQSYSLYALFRTEGISRSTAQALVFVVAALAVAGLARRVPTSRTDRGAFCVALGLALLTTPILWPHYLVLLLVPIALSRRTFSAWWLFPLLYWLDADGWSYADPIKIAPALALAAVPFALALRTAE
jgi:alpha-1,2-mannosyltransferase